MTNCLFCTELLMFSETRHHTTRGYCNSYSEGTKMQIPKAAHVKSRIDNAASAAELEAMKMISELLNSTSTFPLYIEQTKGMTSALKVKFENAGWQVRIEAGEMMKPSSWCFNY